MDTAKIYTVFISYSWTTEHHQNWVENLATRLVETGIDVKLDKWDLKPGNDKFVFMEEMVNNPDIDKVLIVIDKGYKEKADAREGGVGTETYIITPGVYGKEKQEKFIPLIREAGNVFDEYLPHYLKSRIALDFTDNSNFANRFEELVRVIIERPLHQKPKLGILPRRLFEDKKIIRSTSIQKLELDGMNKRNKESVYSFLDEFIDSVIDEIKEFRVPLEKFDGETANDDVIFESIDEMYELRDDYIEFFRIISGFQDDTYITKIQYLFEKLYEVIFEQKKLSKYDYEEDSIKFIVQMMFVSSIAILFSRRSFASIERFLATPYHTKRRGNSVVISYSDFRFYIKSLDDIRNKRLNARRVSIVADKMYVSLEKFGEDFRTNYLESELVLHYISVLRRNELQRNLWFPTTYIYANEYNNSILDRMISKQYSEEIKLLFGVATIKELKDLISNYSRAYRGYNDGMKSIPHISEMVDIDKIATYR